jgi:O-antigen ligase
MCKEKFGDDNMQNVELKLKKSKALISIDKVIYILLILYFTFIYIIPSTIFPYRPYAISIIGIVFFLMVFLIKQKRIRINYVSVSLVALYVIFILSGLINNDGHLLQNIQKMLQSLLLYFGLSSFIDSEKKLVKSLSIIFYTGIIGGPIIGIFQMISGEYLFPLPVDSLYGENRLIQTVISTATQYNANLVAIQLAVTFFIGLFLINISNKKKILLFILTSISCISIFLTFSRTTIIATVLAMIIYEIRMNKKTSIQVKLLRSSFVFILVIGLTMNVDIILSKLLNDPNLAFLFRIKGSENVSIRFLQWSAIMDVILNSNLIKFFLGYGGNYVNELGNLTGFYISSHNTFLEILIKNGIIAFIIFVSLYISVFKRIYKMARKDIDYISVLCMIITVLISLQMISSFGTESIILMILATYRSQKYEGVGVLKNE